MRRLLQPYYLVEKSLGSVLSRQIARAFETFPFFLSCLNRSIASECVEVVGLHVTNAPRRGDTQQPLLQRQVFVPNVEKDLSVKDPHFAAYKQAVLLLIEKNTSVLQKKYPGLQEPNGVCSNPGICIDVKRDNAPFLELLCDVLDSSEGKRSPSKFCKVNNFGTMLTEAASWG